MQLRPVASYNQEKNLEGAKENAWEFLLDATDEEACYSLSDLLDANLTDERLHELLLKLVGMYPKDVEAFLQISLSFDKKNQDLLAYIHLQAAVSLLLQMIPNEFCWETGKINYNALNNRPFFRAYHALAEIYYEMDNIEEAIMICERLISVHANDDIGARNTLLKCDEKTKNISRSNPTQIPT